MTLSGLSAFYAYLREREAIRRRRAAGEPWPWTQDPILRAYKFTNVKREHDRTSRELIEHLYAPHAAAPVEEVVFNAAVYRYFGTSEFARAVGWLHPEPGSLTHVKLVAHGRRARGERVFTGSYIVTNAGRPGDKIAMVCSFLEDLRTNHLSAVAEAITQEHRLEAVVAALRGADGFATFMAKEVALDTFYTQAWEPGGRWDADTWTAIGPGARRGAARVLTADGRLDRPLTEGAALDVCRELYAARAAQWPAEYILLALDDIQFQLCEFDKYTRVRRDEGRPRARYQPPMEALRW